MSRRTILFHSLAHARAACAAAAEAGVPLALQTAPGAAAYAGSQYLKAIVDKVAAEFPGVDLDAAIDCGDDAGTAQGALRIGWKAVCFSGPSPVRDKLADIATQCDARILAADAGGPALDLLDDPDPAAQCRRFLAAGAR